MILDCLCETKKNNTKSIEEKSWTINTESPWTITVNNNKWVLTWKNDDLCLNFPPTDTITNKTYNFHIDETPTISTSSINIYNTYTVATGSNHSSESKNEFNL